QHRMHDEFVAFEKMVATKDFDSVAKQLEHSRQVMEVLDQASKAL
ncbi:MAG: gfo/Idh/MocA family oxidoreductase, partial [Streptococcus salivarius]|nr:gfo/Idh/MocA family oxidoreductase [Streptococcus salivarius]